MDLTCINCELTQLIRLLESIDEIEKIMAHRFSL